MTLNLCCALNGTGECILCKARFCSQCKTDKNHPVVGYRGTSMREQVRCKSTNCTTVIIPFDTDE